MNLDLLTMRCWSFRLHWLDALMQIRIKSESNHDSYQLDVDRDQ